MTCHTFGLVADPTAPECQRAGGVRLPEGVGMATLTPDEIRAELTDALDEWRRYDPRLGRAGCLPEHGDWIDFLLDEMAEREA